MVSSSETEETLEGAVSGIAQVALAIAAIPTEHRKQALLAAKIAGTRCMASSLAVTIPTT